MAATTEKATTKKSTAKGAGKSQVTKAQITKALRDWSKAHDGKAPTSADIWPARLRQRAAKAKTAEERKRLEKAARDHEAAGLPIVPQIVRVYGSWNAAVEAAGLMPKRGVGRKS